MSLLGGAVLALLLALVCAAKRPAAALALMAGTLYLTQGEVLELGVHLYPQRVLGLAACLRVLARGEFPAGGLNRIDRALVLAYGYTTAVFLLRSAFGQATDASIAQVSALDKVGILADVLLGYFAFRGLIVGLDEFIGFLRGFAVLLAPYVALLAVEWSSGHNPLAVVGGLPDLWVDGARLRCRGSFRHPSLLGTLGASFFPLYVGLALVPGQRVAGWGGVLLCLAIVFFSGSGGPASFVGVGLLGWLLWSVRAQMAWVRRGMVATLALLALVMKKPLWYLPDRLSAITGGDGWHRSYLMDQAFTNIGHWWLAGMPLDATREWFPYLVMGAVDITNLYISFGIDAGLIALALFVLLLVRAFSALGSALAAARRAAPDSSAAEFLLWGLGAALAGHMANWIGITYFDQTYLVWLMQLAAISGLKQGGDALAAVSAAPAPARLPYQRYRQTSC